jgi:RND superfamily putative drug exporter
VRERFGETVVDSLFRESETRPMPIQTDDAAVTERQSVPADRFARLLRRSRWPVLAAWVIAVMLLYPLAHGLANATKDTAAANLPASAPSTKVTELQEAAQRGQPESDQVTVVFVRDSGLTAADDQVIGAAHAAVARLVGPIDLAAPPGSRSAATDRGVRLDEPGPAQQSADGKAAQFTTKVTAPGGSMANPDADAVTAVRAAVAGAIRHAEPGLRSAVTGSAALNADSGIGNQNTLLLISLTIVFIVLLIVYRSPLLWAFPLLGTAGALVVAKAAAHGVADTGLTVTSLSSSILTVLVLGASTDYALLLIHRYRDELRRHPTTADAMAVALRRTLPAVAASAATVICAMLCLLAARSASLHGLGPIGAASLAAAFLAQVTLLPAVLLTVGRPAFWPLVPRDGATSRGESRVWTSIGARVARRPIAVVCVSVALLGAACVGLATLHTDNNPIALVKGHPGSVSGEQMISDHFPPGDLAPLVLLTPPAQTGAAFEAARATADVASVSPAQALGGYAAYTVTLSVPPYSDKGYATIARLRNRVDTVARGSLIGGGPAVQYDTSQAAGDDAGVLIPLVLAVILVIIAVLLRAVVAPVVLVATTALSFAASLGLSSLLWHVMGLPGIQAQLPLYVFVFLIALGVDYNIFLIARIREEARSTGIREGTLRGLSVTGGVITAAGVVLAATFAALARLPYVPVAQVGTAIAVGVLLDTLLVRTVLVPAGLLALGERVWWPSSSLLNRRVSPDPAAKSVRLST